MNWLGCEGENESELNIHPSKQYRRINELIENKLGRHQNFPTIITEIAAGACECNLPPSTFFLNPNESKT